MIIDDIKKLYFEPQKAMKVIKDTINYSREIYKITKRTFIYLSKWQQKTLAELIVAFLYNESFTIREIASKFPQSTNVKHKLKRLQNFLDKIQLNKEFWHSYIITLFSLPHFSFKKRKYITIVLDFTTLKEDFLILGASISYQGRAIPIYLKVWKGVNKSYDFWKRVKEFLRELKSLLPQHNYVLVCDRGFASIQLFEITAKTGWKNCIVRINDSWSIKRSNDDKFIKLNTLKEGYYGQVTLGKNSQIEYISVVVSSIKDEKGKKHYWYLAARIEDPIRIENKWKFIKNCYEQRMWIEESFKDLKQILKWEKYTEKIPLKNRMENLVVISCLSYALQICIGTQIDVPNSEKKKTSIIKRVRHILVQIHRMNNILTKIITLFCIYLWRDIHYFSNFHG